MQEPLTFPAQSQADRARSAWSLSAIMAGFLAVLISYSGPLVIFLQAAHAANLPADMVTSWVWGISIGAGVSGLLLSGWLKVPVVTAWSAPGTALLVTLFPQLSLADAVGAYVSAAAILFVIGISGSFDWLVQRIPRGIAAGMMAGILFQFGAGAFKAAATLSLLAGVMIVTYLVCRRWLQRYCMIVVLAVGVAVAAMLGLTHAGDLHLALARPVFTAPHWSLGATLSLAIPLVIVSLTGQFLPGMAILHLSGYRTPARPILAVTSLASAAVACFGGITIVTAAITAALCTGKDAHEDPARRYVAGLANGGFYLVGGTFAGTIVLLFDALPHAFVAVLAGLALVGAIMSNVMEAITQDDHREASVITFLATASGMTMFGLGSAFWGIVIGSVAWLILHSKPRQAQGAAPQK